MTQRIDRLRIRSKKECLGVHKLLPDDHLIGTLSAKVREAEMFCEDRDSRDLRKIDLNRPVELELVEQCVSRRGSGITVLELEIAELGFDRLCA